MEEVKVVGGSWLSQPSTTDVQTIYSFRLLSASSSSSSCRLRSGAEGPFDYSHAHFELSVGESVGVVVNKAAE